MAALSVCGPTFQIHLESDHGTAGRHSGRFSPSMRDIRTPPGKLFSDVAMPGPLEGGAGGASIATKDELVRRTPAVTRKIIRVH